MFGGTTGTIMIMTAGSFASGQHGPVAAPFMLSNIEDPYKVFKHFQKLAHAVKTDIEFPKSIGRQRTLATTRNTSRRTNRDTQIA